MEWERVGHEGWIRLRTPSAWFEGEGLRARGAGSLAKQCG